MTMPDKDAAPATAKAADPVKQEIARTLGRLLWDREFKKANPDATSEARQAAWQAARGEYVKAARQIAGRLERAGFVITTSAEK
jgi:hypothetical protein